MPADSITGSAVGFWGKLPSRGDFVRVGLSRGFVDPWDAWFSQALTDARARLGDGWHDAWMVAPLWRFALSADLCGPSAVVGLWMPSVDRAGRHFPLTIAAEIPGATASDLAASATAWLDEVEAAGRVALEAQSLPEELAARLPPFAGAPAAEPWDAACLWWTEGSPMVDAQHLALATLPGPDQFLRMLAGASA